jgi:hypothetical protein
MLDTSEIITSKTHIEPLAEDGFIIYKLGYISPVVDGKREARMIWGNRRNSTINLPLQITGITLLSASWTLISGFYEYDIANANITATSEVEVIFMKSTIAIVKAADIMPDNLSDTGTVKIYATNQPTGDINVTLIITEVTV